jgi:hypothetical protein
VVKLDAIALKIIVYPAAADRLLRDDVTAAAGTEFHGNNRSQKHTFAVNRQGMAVPATTLRELNILCHTNEVENGQRNTPLVDTTFTCFLF